MSIEFNISIEGNWMSAGETEGQSFGEGTAAQGNHESHSILIFSFDYISYIKNINV